MKDNGGVRNEKAKLSGIVFGVFDGMHEGHKHFLSEASKLADKLTIVLTLPETAVILKGRSPRHSYEERKAAIRAFKPDAEIVPSDAKLGEWSVFKNRKPCLVILGYDQQGIAKELEKIGVYFIFIDSHYPEKYKSSLLNREII